MELNKIYLGNCLEVIKTFEDESIDCCITSPPYYRLRDYGTGEWIGGDENCSHKRDSKFSENTITGHSNPDLVVGDAIYKSTCPKCGAIRKDEQLGLEETPEEYVDNMVKLFIEVKRILKPTGTLWLNLGDSYYGSGKGQTHTGCNDPKQPKLDGMKLPINNVHDELKQKDLIGIPWMVAFALRSDGWYLRQDIIWSKPNPMPESVTDRCTKSHEYVFLLSKNKNYYYDNDAIKEKSQLGRDWTKTGGNLMGKGIHKQGGKYVNLGEGRKYKGNTLNGGDGSGFINHSGYSNLPNPEVRNKRSVWTVTTKPFKEAHFATFPEDLIEPMVKAGCPENGIVLDPFMGAGTTAVVCKKLKRNYVGIELNSEYIKIAEKRIKDTKSNTLF